MSNRPQRSVRVSDQSWICLLGVNPKVLCERTASDILSHQIETDNKVGLPEEAVFVATKQVHSQFKTVARPRCYGCGHPLDNPLSRRQRRQAETQPMVLCSMTSARSDLRCLQSPHYNPR